MIFDLFHEGDFVKEYIVETARFNVVVNNIILEPNAQRITRTTYNISFNISKYREDKVGNVDIRYVLPPHLALFDTPAYNIESYTITWANKSAIPYNHILEVYEEEIRVEGIATFEDHVSLVIKNVDISQDINQDSPFEIIVTIPNSTNFQQIQQVRRTTKMIIPIYLFLAFVGLIFMLLRFVYVGENAQIGTKFLMSLMSFIFLATTVMLSFELTTFEGSIEYTMAYYYIGALWAIPMILMFLDAFMVALGALQLRKQRQMQ